MGFFVLDQDPRQYDANAFYLIKGYLFKGRYNDSWNDFGYHTIYTLQYCDELLNVIVIGTLQIGEFSMSEDQTTPNLPSHFTKLNPDRFFSFSHSSDYYKNIANIENEKGYDALLSLNDFTLCKDVFEKAKDEKVTKLSLLRYIPEKDYDTHVLKFYELLKPPINLTTMRRIFGSTGWDDIDCGLVEMQRLLFNANIHYYYNAIATIGREILKGVSQKIYNDDLHRNKDKYPCVPKEDQYINKLHGYVDYAYSENEISKNLKDYIKSTIELVQGYVHKDKAENFECFMCVHAVISLVFQLSIISKKEKYNEIMNSENC